MENNLVKLCQILGFSSIHIPAKVDAKCICDLASRSSWLYTALSKYLFKIPNACLAHTSEIGLEPWYAGRNLGFDGRGDLSLKLIAVKDSSAWQRTSNLKM